MAFDDTQKGNEPSQYVELIEMSIGQETFYYTSFEKNYTFNNIIYEAISIKTKDFKSDVKMSPTPMKLTLSLSEPAIRYVANTPTEVIKVTITLVVIDNPTETKVFYIGRVMSVEFDDNGLTINLESKSDVFRQKIPGVKHTSLCNNLLFDEVCGLQELLFSFDATLSVVNDTTLVSSAFATKPDQWLRKGKIRTSYNDVRMITNHVGDTVTIQIGFDQRLTVGSVVKAIAGCDRRRTTCDVKFNNLENNVSMGEIPSRNPAMWGVEGTK